MPEGSQLELIHIYWQGPLSIRNAMEADGPTNYGVYALYGTHDVFGPDALLYVGKADANTFPSRIGYHKEEWCDPAASEIAVYFGRIASDHPLTDEQWSIQITRAEALLLYYLSPPYNEKGKKRMNVLMPTLVVNHRRRHRVPWCVSNLPDLVELNDFRLCGGDGHKPPALPEP